MKRPWLVRGDVDGFFGLFVDNLVQLMAISALCATVSGIPTHFIISRILPGAAISILLGNLFYTWQARRLMRATGRDDVTALPYGINTPTVFAYVLLIMGPAYRAALAAGEAQDAAWRVAWQIGLLACLGSGIIEIIGAFLGGWMRRYTPRAALLSALAGIAITFIAMGFVFQLFAAPEIGLLPMLIVVLAYAARTRLPLRLPAGLVAVVVGAAIAWLLVAAGWTQWRPSSQPLDVGLYWPRWSGQDVVALLRSPLAWSYLAVIFPMGLFNVIGSLQNLESAEAAGDRYATTPSLLVNGVGSLTAAFLGSPFPTTIYIGHPGWKAMGARAGYSALNGLIITGLVLFGGIAVVLRVVPIEAALGILLWIGIIITAQAFEAVPRSHALAVAFGLVPALAAWGRTWLESALASGGTSLFQAQGALQQQGVYVHGVLALDSGFLLTSMIWAAVMVYAIERRFAVAAAWLGGAAALSLTGIIHGYSLTSEGVRAAFGPTAAPAFTVGYALACILMLSMHIGRRRAELQYVQRSDPTLGAHV